MSSRAIRAAASTSSPSARRISSPATRSAPSVGLAGAGSLIRGTQARANVGDGILIEERRKHHRRRIPYAGNVIAGNNRNGVTIENDGTDTSATGNRVQGNDIGFDTRVGQLYLIPNFADGVYISASGNLVGGDTSAAMNIIIDNGQNGVAIVAAAPGSPPRPRISSRGIISAPTSERPLRQRFQWCLPLGGVGQHDRWHHRRGRERHLRQFRRWQ